MEKMKMRATNKITDAVKKMVGATALAPKGFGKRPVGPEEVSRRIQDKAYELYENRGACHGDDQADWYNAERIVRAEIDRG
jgi:hypothetical protein